ncbi:MAG TPA: hypothetical protein VGN72_14470 [Tepidisphaeraceae bacterium]|jgi:hypothetical protein|nr:hypothetical protein [Tepidisphaeraceae bacterium]
MQDLRDPLPRKYDVDPEALAQFIADAGERRTKPIKLSFRGRQGFSKDVGRYRKPDDNKVVGKRFWLGHDQARSTWLASIISEYHQQFVQGDGDGLWTSAHLKAIEFIVDARDHITRRKAERLRGELAGFNQRPPVADIQPLTFSLSPAVVIPMRPAAPAKSTQGDSLYGAIDAYLATLNGKRVSDAHKWRAKQVLDRTLKGIRSDCPLAEINYLWLDRLADHFKARPKTRRGGPMRPETVVTTLRYIRTFFAWCDDVAFGGWEGPRKLVRPFRVRANDLMSPVELRAAATIEQFDVGILAKLYQSGSEFQQMLILAGLFIGATQKELAVLEKQEFDLANGILAHYRNKTQVLGTFWLPPELVTRLRAEFAKHPNAPLAMYTEDGNPLVWFKNERIACDSVRLMWDRLRIKAGTPNAPSFKFLRKFAGDFAMRYGGQEMGQVALSHARQTVLAKNYSSARDFDAFMAVQQQMYAELKASGMFDSVVRRKYTRHPRADRDACSNRLRSRDARIGERPEREPRSRKQA